MRFRPHGTWVGGLAASMLVGGCSGLLGLDDFSAGGDDATSASSGDATTGSASSGSSSVSGSVSGSASSGTSDGGGGSSTTSDGGGGSSTTSDGGGGGSTTSDGGGGSTSSDGGGGSSTTSDGGGGSTSSDGGGGGVVDPGPTVVITSASVGQNQTTNSSRATFLFGSDPPGSAVSFGCDLDNSGTFADCTSGFDQTLLSGGSHSLRVRGTNLAGVVGPVLERRWVIEALGSTIPAIRMGVVPEQTLVTVTTNVRMTTMLTFGGQQNIFIQDQNASTLALARNHGLRTLARVAQAPMQAGLALTVTGTYQIVDGSQLLNAAEYLRGAQLAAYAPYFTNDTEELDDESMESVAVALDGRIPTNFNCSSCSNPSQGFCLHGCYACSPLPFRDFTGAGQQQTFEFGSYRGVIVGNTDRQLWFVESDEAGDDICL